MEYELKRGQALVLVGPQGCGKTTLARAIAKEHGSFAEVDAAQIGTPRGLREVMLTKPKTLVVDGMPENEEIAPALKAMIAGETVAFREPYAKRPFVKVPAPNFIFCTCDDDPLPGIESSRRFRIVRIGQDMKAPNA